MKTKNLTGILLSVSGVGLVAFILWKMMKPKTTAAAAAAAASPTANPQTAAPASAVYNGFGKLFGGQAQTDNTGALITSGGSAFTSAVNSFKSIFGPSSQVSGTPVQSPVSNGIPLASDGAVTSTDVPVYDYSLYE